MKGLCNDYDVTKGVRRRFNGAVNLLMSYIMIQDELLNSQGAKWQLLMTVLTVPRQRGGRVNILLVG